jgi:hypothetical protein
LRQVVYPIEREGTAKHPIARKRCALCGSVITVRTRIICVAVEMVQRYQLVCQQGFDEGDCAQENQKDGCDPHTYE